MVCLGFEPGAAGWQAKTKPRSYGGQLQFMTLIFYFKVKCFKLQDLNQASYYTNNVHEPNREQVKNSTIFGGINLNAEERNTIFKGLFHFMGRTTSKKIAQVNVRKFKFYSVIRTQIDPSKEEKSYRLKVFYFQYLYKLSKEK